MLFNFRHVQKCKWICMVSHNLLKSGFLAVASNRPSGGRELFLFSKRVVLDSCFLHWLALAPFLFLYCRVAVNRWLVMCRWDRDFNNHLNLQSQREKSRISSIITKEFFFCCNKRQGSNVHNRLHSRLN